MSGYRPCKSRNYLTLLIWGEAMPCKSKLKSPKSPNLLDVYDAQLGIAPLSVVYDARFNI